MRTTVKLGLTSWDQISDRYNYAQLAGNWQIVDFHDHSPGNGVPISAGGIAPGAVLSNSIAAGVVQSFHLSSGIVPNIFNINTTSLTSAQIDAALPSGAVAVDGALIRDATNNLLLIRQNGKWNKTAALTQIS